MQRATSRRPSRSRSRSCRRSPDYRRRRSRSRELKKTLQSMVKPRDRSKEKERNSSRKERSRRSSSSSTSSSASGCNSKRDNQRIQAFSAVPAVVQKKGTSIKDSICPYCKQDLQSELRLEIHKLWKHVDESYLELRVVDKSSGTHRT